MLLTAFALLIPADTFAQSPYKLVDPLIGTANKGQTVPVVGMPFGMTGWTPETRSTEAHCVAPYYYDDKLITGFRASHWLSGSCTQDYGSVSLMPTTGPLAVTPESRASGFQHAHEVSTPAYYATVLDRFSTRVELTGTKRSGMMRIESPRGMDLNIVLQPNSKASEGFVRVLADRQEIVGYNPVRRIYQGSGQSAGFNGYFVAKFQQPFPSFGVWCGNLIQQNQVEQKGGCRDLGAFVTFPSWKGGSLLVKVGTSFTSLEEAENNLDSEEPDWNFDHIRHQSEAAWSGLLGRIRVQGGTTEEQVQFYTALYHSMLAPRVVNDVDGTYSGFGQEGKIHRAVGRDYYDDFSLWDTFRALHPLLTILDPERESQMVQSLVDKGTQGGFLPIFPAWNNYTSEMIGDPAVAVIVDAYAKGLRRFDVDEAYRLVLQNATVTPSVPKYQDGRGRRALDSYQQYGFIPLEDDVPDAYHKREQVSRTLEYAYADSLVAKFATALGHTEDATMLAARSNSWKNVFDPSVGFVRGRHEDGGWSTPFHPDEGYSYITEGLPWQYTFFIPQDLPGLIDAVGGRENFVSKLDGLFSRKLYEQGNEPGHHIPYLYNYAGAPWKTQERVREILQSEYHTGPGGLPGNDDAGQMSAWYVLCAMGFYPICPGVPTYTLSSPLFSHISIRQPNGKHFEISAPQSSRSNRYIQSVRLNGAALPGHEITHADIVGGSKMKVSLGAVPKK